jgi:hypothetical protein
MPKEQSRRKFFYGNYFLPLSLLVLAGAIVWAGAATGKIENSGHASSVPMLDYEVVNGRFTTSRGVVPGACFSPLVTKLDGDNVIAAVRVNQGRCWEDAVCDENAEFRSIENVEDHTYRIMLEQCVSSEVGAYFDKIIIRFKELSYSRPGFDREDLVAEKIGEWE